MINCSSKRIKSRRGQRWLAVGLAVVGAGLAGRALAASNGAAGYDLRVWQTDEGLPQNSVTAIAQSADGFLWVGTRAGLARFDGVRGSPWNMSI